MLIPHSRSRITISVVAAAVLIAVTGCSGGDGHDMESMSDSGHSTASSMPTTSSTGVVSTQFNAADVTFASDMYPHHAQAVAMAQLVAGRSTDPEIISLAGTIEAAQAPEMDQLSRWLQAWGQSPPMSSMPGDKSGTDHSGHGMDGMMSDQQMADLASKAGPDFDQAWLTMMIEHHSGAIDMAESEMSDGINPDAKAMARNIITSQQDEITSMEALQD